MRSSCGADDGPKSLPTQERLFGKNSNEGRKTAVNQFMPSSYRLDCSKISSHWRLLKDSCKPASRCVSPCGGATQWCRQPWRRPIYMSIGALRCTEPRGNVARFAPTTGPCHCCGRLPSLSRKCCPPRPAHALQIGWKEAREYGSRQLNDKSVCSHANPGIKHKRRGDRTEAVPVVLSEQKTRSRYLHNRPTRFR